MLKLLLKCTYLKKKCYIESGNQKKIIIRFDLNLIRQKVMQSCTGMLQLHEVDIGRLYPCL